MAPRSSSIALSFVLAVSAVACGVEFSGKIPNSDTGEPAEEPGEGDPGTTPSPGGTTKPGKPNPPSTPTTPTPASCDATKAFGAPKKITTLSNPNIADEGVRFYLGETRAVLARDMGSSYDLYETTLAAGSYGEPTLMVSLSMSGSDDTFASISENGLSLVFASTRTTYGDADVFASKRSSLTAEWSKPVALSSGNSNANSFGDEADPYLAPAGDRLYFASDRDGTFTIFETAITFGASITTTNATKLEPLAGAGVQVRHPVVTSDGLTIYYSRGTLSSRDVWKASRTKTSEPFSGAAKIGELSTNSDEYPTWVSVDGCRLILSGYYGSSSRDIFVAEKPK